MESDYPNPPILEIGYPEPTNLGNWISNDNTFINNKHWFPFTQKRPHTVTKMNNSIIMDSTTAGSMNVHR
jgi:hypothetical protein